MLIWETVGRPVLTLAVGAAVGWVLWRLAFAALHAGARRAASVTGQVLLDYWRRPSRLLIPLMGLTAAVPAAGLPAAVSGPLGHGLALALIANAAWMIVELAGASAALVLRHHRVDVSDNLVARQMETRVVVLRRVASGVTVLVAVSVMLLTFPVAWRLGASLLASAGLLGIVAGMAAQPVLSNLLAGVQIALTQPIRLEDVVIVEGEWGWIEEITATYVVVRIWDLRRLVLPLSYFIQQPFQNWTRRTADLLGYIHLYVDYTVPVDALRQELHRVLQETELWDRKAWGLQATEATDRCLQVRCLMSAADSGRRWDLCCLVREKMVDFLRTEYPDALPRVRVEMPAGGPVPNVQA